MTSAQLELTEPQTNPTSQLLLALDFDGTIAPIVGRPDDARIDPEFAQLIAEVSELPGVKVAIISGRDLEDLYLRTTSLTVYRAGSHGADCADPDGRILWGAECSPLAVGEPLSSMLIEGDFRIERKKCAIAIHFRHLAPHAVREDILDEFRAWAQRHGLEVVAGRSVLEARLPIRNKASALRLLARYTRAERVVFAGDDTTDFEALSWAASRGRGVFVESEEREPPADERVMRVRSLEELRQLVRSEADECVRAAAEMR